MPEFVVWVDTSDPKGFYELGIKVVGLGSFWGCKKYGISEADATKLREIGRWEVRKHAQRAA